MKTITHVFTTIFILTVFLSATVFSQSVPIGNWKEYLSYNEAISIANNGSLLYVATPDGIVSNNTATGEVKFLTKIETLNDISIGSISFNNNTKQLVIGYKNGNLDLITSNTTINIPAIKNSDITGDKTINSIFSYNEFAYLACGFGIVVIDTRKKEVKDSYIIGDNGTNLNINEIIIKENVIYAATDKGVYSANVNNNFLNDFNSWTQASDLPLPNGKYNSIAYSTGHILVNLDNGNNDTLYQNDGTGWKKVTTVANINTQNLHFLNNHFLVNHTDSITLLNDTFAKVESFVNYTSFWTLRANDMVFINGSYWVADGRISLTRIQGNLNGQVYPELWKGPEQNTTVDLEVKDGQLWGATGVISGTNWNNTLNFEGAYHYNISEDKWAYYKGGADPNAGLLVDYLGVIVNPNDAKKAYACAFAETGLLEYGNGSLLNYFDSSNSTLGPNVFKCSPSECAYSIAAGDFDDDDNLWVGVSRTTNPVSVKDINGNWNSFYCGNESQDQLVSKVIADKTNGYKWFLLHKKHIIAYNPGETPLDDSDDQYKIIGNGIGAGNLHSPPVCFVEDLDGEIWIGTEEGLTVLFNPLNIFEGGDYDAQRIKIEQDGNVEFLLSSESITALEVDGGNRKWVGTIASGVFVLSPDGQELINHFTFDNSPLFSNEIYDIAIDQQSGEVFISTAEGLISYRGTATEGQDIFTDVYAFPNPIQADYTGPITIKGLMKDSDVKIADLTGNIVFATTSVGGQAIWDGNNLQGERVQSGIYVVFLAGPEGRKTEVTKLMVLN